MRISDWSSDVCSSDLVRTSTSHRVCVTHQNQRRFGMARAEFGRDLQQVRRFGASSQTAQVGCLNGGAISHWVREGHAKFNNVGASFNQGIQNNRHIIGCWIPSRDKNRSEEHTSELQSLMRISYAVFCLK